MGKVSSLFLLECCALILWVVWKGKSEFLTIFRPYEKMDLAVGIITLVYAIVLIVLGCMFKEGDTAPTSSEPKKISPGQV